MNDRLKGMLIALAGILVLSPDSMFVRLIDVDQWAMIFWRGLGQGVVLLACTAFLYRGDFFRRLFAMGLPGVLVALCFVGSSVLFVTALYYTSVANTLVIISAAPMFGAIQSAVFLKEKLPLRTWIAIALSMACVAVILYGSLGGGTIWGDVAALVQAMFMAGTFVLVRVRPGVNMVPAMGISGLLIAVAFLPLALSAPVPSESVPLLGLLCFAVLPLAFGLLTLAPRYIPAPEVSMIMLLEMILGPLFTWIAVSEAVPMSTVVGGALLFGTLTIHAYMSLKAGE